MINYCWSRSFWSCSITSCVSFSLQTIKSSCTVAPLLMIHLIPLVVVYDILKRRVEDHFCCLEILPGIILEIRRCFSISKRSLWNSGKMWCMVLVLMNLIFILDDKLINWKKLYYKIVFLFSMLSIYETFNTLVTYWS